MKKVAIASFFAGWLVAGPWQTHTELSYIQTSGNTDTSSFGVDFHAQKKWLPHEVAFDFESNYAESGGRETKNIWLLETHYYYHFSKSLEIEYLTGYKQDKFSGFEYQFYTGPGLGWQVVQTSKQKFSLNLLLLYSIDSYTTDKKDIYLSGRTGVEYTYHITPMLSFVEEANWRSDLSQPSNWFLYSKSSFYNTIDGKLKLGVSYKIDYKNNPPKGKKKMDRTLMVSLVVDW